MKLRIFAALAVACMLVGGLVAHSLAAGMDGQISGTAVGAKAPAFSLPDQSGKTFSLSEYSGKIVVLEWTNPDCPIVQRVYHQKIMHDTSAQFADKVVWLAVNSSNSATNQQDQQWKVEQDIAYPILNDASGAIGHAYGATNTPHMFIIGKDGTLLYKGAIDNDRRGEMTSGKINYVAQALDEILTGKPVSIPQTQAYGCSVKYAN